MKLFIKYKIKFIIAIIIWVIFNIYMIMKNIPKYKKYIKLDEEIQYDLNKKILLIYLLNIS